MRRLILALAILAPVTAAPLLAFGYWGFALSILFGAHALWLVATLTPACSWWGEVITQFETKEKELWLTIDDGPDPLETLALLELLDRHQARAVFFFIGEKAAQHPELVSEVIRRGHLVGNHTQHHPAGWFWSYPRRRVRAEITQCSQVIANAGCPRPHWFRAPAGFRNHHVHPILQETGQRLMGWSARGFDGVRSNSGKVFERLNMGIRPGAILLLHEGRGTAVALVTRLLWRIDELGYRCVLPN